MNEENKSNEIFASLEKRTLEFKKIVADMKDGDPLPNEFHAKLAALADDMYSSMKYLHSNMQQSHAYMHNKIDNNHKQFMEHKNGHAPAFKSNKHLQNFLKACDMTSDYEVSPQGITTSSYAYKITASKSKGIKVELDLTKFKEGNS